MLFRAEEFKQMNSIFEKSILTTNSIVVIKNFSLKKYPCQFDTYFYFKIRFQFLGNRNGSGCESDVDDADIADKEELKLSYVGSDDEDEDYGSSARSPFVKN